MKALLELPITSLFLGMQKEFFQWMISYVNRPKTEKAMQDHLESLIQAIEKTKDCFKQPQKGLEER